MGKAVDLESPLLEIVSRLEVWLKSASPTRPVEEFRDIVDSLKLLSLRAMLLWDDDGQRTLYPQDFEDTG